MSPARTRGRNALVRFIFITWRSSLGKCVGCMTWSAITGQTQSMPREVLEDRGTTQGGAEHAFMGSMVVDCGRANAGKIHEARAAELMPAFGCVARAWGL
mmetsp:Transcript_2055/g.5496  ORF Transcript_2055/g.5496 Transcript_2055/m.5496 type:complete len:100 (+) Transcript_2055:1814-2113(+)